MYIAHPFGLDGRGSTRISQRDRWIRGLVEEVLFTSPGERINRPSFGSGVKQLVFSPGGDQTAVATEHLIQGALQQWLGDLIRVEGVSVEVEEATLRVRVRYVERKSGLRQTTELVRSV